MKALFPLDGSDETYRALERGLRFLGSAEDHPVTCLVVISKGLRDMPPEAREHLEFDDEDEVFIRDDEAKAVLKRAEAIAAKVKFGPIQGRMIVGKVKETIVKEAAKFDLLVMHRLDRDEAGEDRRGSATAEIARTAACSVLLVRTD